MSIAAIDTAMNFPDLLEGVEAAPIVARKSRKKKSKAKKVSDPPASPPDSQNDILLDDLLSDVGSGATGTATGDSKSNGSAGRSTKGADFVDAIAIPSNQGDKMKVFDPAGHNTPSTNDSTQSYRSISDHDKVQESLFIPSFGASKKALIASMEEEADVESAQLSEDGSVDAAALLQLAKKRVGWQNLQEENVKLKETIEKKNEELGLLHGQLRQAVASKCDLVVANQEMEKQHEQAIFEQEESVLRLQAANKYILEQYAQTEKELLNELIRLNDDVRTVLNETSTLTFVTQLKSLEKKRQEELDDWERLHGNEICNKNAEISALREQLHQAGLVPTTVPKPPRKQIGALLFGL